MRAYDFETSFQKVIRLEGGFTLHRNATESAQTYAGIYRKAHPGWEGWSYIDRRAQPPTELVRRFYRDHYWERLPGEDSPAKYLLFEFGVNAGLAKAVKVAQVVLGLVPDGVIGPRTAAALGDHGNSDTFATAFTLARIKHYTDLANRNPDKYALYLRGWINRALEALS